MTNRSAPLIVCPACFYAFPDQGQAGIEFVCPRSDCGHRWEVVGETSALIQGATRRQERPELHVVAGGPTKKVDLPEGESLIGRDHLCLLSLDNLAVSRRHARLFREGEAVWIEDLSGSWGTIVNKEKIKGRRQLVPRDRVIIAGITIEYAVRYEAKETASNLVDNSVLFSQGSNSGPLIAGLRTETIPLVNNRISFGRGKDRDVILPNAMISTRQAVIENTTDGYYLSDTQSRIGTFVNGKSVIRVKLAPGDRIQFGPYLFRFESGQLVRVYQPTSLALVARNISQTAGKVRLLDNISFVLQPGEFVGLLGPSGAGKSTLLNALNGTRQAAMGDVFINGESLYDEYERFRHHIGYVPQDDIIHRELTSRQALSYVGRLRLPTDTTSEELNTKVEETLQELELGERSNVPIDRLSGGQRKRASVGVELLSKTGIIFLDEPTSGLDPATEARLMRTFRRLANQGRTVICTTHVMENVDLFDKVAVLAPGGKLAFFGPPSEAKAYFEIDKFTLLYDKLEEKSPDEWQQQYQKSKFYVQFVAPAVTGKALEIPVRRRRRLKLGNPPSIFGQWWVLVNRFCRTLLADKQNVVLLAAQPVIIAGLTCLVSRDLPLIFFVLIIAAIWFGCSLGAQQIVKERPVYLRERMVNLRLDCYVFSKFVPLAIIAALQCLIMLAISSVIVGRDGVGWVQLFALVLSAWNGVALGLLISSLATNADKAVSVVPLTLIPQIIFAGVLVPVAEMNQPTWFASNLMISRWANQAVEISLLQNKTIDPGLVTQRRYHRPLWNLYPRYALDEKGGQEAFLVDHAGEVINQRLPLGVDFLILYMLIVAQLTVLVGVLRGQDTV